MLNHVFLETSIRLLESVSPKPHALKKGVFGVWFFYRNWDWLKAQLFYRQFRNFRSVFDCCLLGSENRVGKISKYGF